MRSFKEFFDIFMENYDSASRLHELPGSSVGLNNRISAIPETPPYGFWMDAHGNWIAVPTPQAHEAVGYDIIHKAQDQYPDIKLNRNESVYDLLFEAGYVRIVVNRLGRKMFWEARQGSRPTYIQMKNLKFMKEFYELEDLVEG